MSGTCFWGSEETALNPSALALSASEAAQKVLPAVVFIAREQNPFDAYHPDPSFVYKGLRPLYEWFYPPKFASGSGFIINPEGYVITNHHVVKNATSLIIALQGLDLRIMKATLVGSDPRTDLAVLKIENPDNLTLPYLKLGDSNQVKIGETVLLIGNPLTPDLEATTTLGIISAKDRNNISFDLIQGYLQTDAAANFGNSGGPLCNLKGEVIGVLKSCVCHFFAEGLNFAIPSKTVKAVFQQISTNGSISQGFLGLELEDDSVSAFNVFFFEKNEGAKIKTVLKNSPAEKSGLKQGDLILEANGFKVFSAQGLKNEICLLKPQTKISLKIKRSDNTIAELSLELEDEKLIKTTAKLPVNYI
ncbi:MAG: trypsin-like peptidase domain-containing protein [Parachlamydiales bacterium]